MNIPQLSRSRCLLVATLFFVGAPACRGEPSAVFTQLTEARRLAADLRVQFSKASAASDRAVLADTDEASILSARDADKIKVWVKNDAEELEARLRQLGHAAELDTLAAFGRSFAAYDQLDHEILLLSVENTNLKAQRLSFGPARDEADAVRDALQAAAASAPAKARCEVDALVGNALVALREIQVLQPPHIAAADDAVMTKLEKDMAARETSARAAVASLAALVDAKGRAFVAAAVASLDKFAVISREIVTLSRRNSNVRSLSMSLREKAAPTAACDDSLRTLQEALAKEAFPATR